MRYTLFATLLLAGASTLGLAADLVADKDGRVPVLMELFTSEGCSSCPPADRLLETFDRTQPIPGAELIVLSEHVDYWDRLGWKDRFSSPQYTARQQEYASKLRLDSAYTPQVVVDGRFEFVGSDARGAQNAVQKTIREPKLPISITKAARHGDQVTARIMLPASAGKTKAGKPYLYVVLADNRAETQVARGENAGRALAHVAVTRSLRLVGPVDMEHDAMRDIVLPVQSDAGTNGLRLIAFVQDRASGQILAVAASEL